MKRVAVARIAVARIALAAIALTIGCREAEPPKPVEPAPVFNLSLVGGGSVSLDALRGQTVLIDFWATWCPPCVLEIEELNALRKELAGTSTRILAISIDTIPPEELAAWVADNGITYPVAIADTDLATAYGADAFPFHVLVGPDGRVLERLESGFHPREELRDLIERHRPAP